ncbi:hypothetical protein DXG01_010971, partial [Tephrocybe rancida]
MHPIVKDLKEYLHEPLVAPKEGDWVRRNSPPLYRGDLAYVCVYNDKSPNCLTTKQKSPGGEGADGRAGWPPRQLLERKDAIRLFGADAVKAHNEEELNFIYRGQTYGDGLQYLVTHEFEPTVLTHEELALFQRCSLVNLGDIAHATNEIAALSLQVTDRVVVTSGELVSMTGVIMEFSGNDKEATVRLNSTEITMDVMLSPTLLRKFKVNVNRVAFHHDAQALAWVVPRQDVSWKPFEENQHLPPPRNLVYLGRSVLKGYEGIIREILEDDEVCVELSATLKRETLHLSQLSN